MGVSNDAYLIFGICWDEEDHQWPWESDEDDEDNVASEDEIMAALEARGLPFGVEVGTHCSANCPMGYVATRSWMALRGYPVKLDLSDPDFTDPVDEDLTVLRAFCEEAGYDFDDLLIQGRVGWFLFSDTH